jgi:CheY-like chemotaxis protein
VHQLTVLLVGDNPWGVRLTQRAFREAGLTHDLRIVCGGDEALAYLLREGIYENPSRAPCPDVIVLDLHLPRSHGYDLLQRLKQDPRFKRVPMIVLTASGRPDDVRQAYEAGANACLVKSDEFPRFIEVLGEFGKFWLEIVELPPEA